MIVRNLIPHITSPTRVTNHTATLIDHIYSNISSENVLPGTLKTDISDHYSNFIILKSILPKTTKNDIISYRAMNSRAIENLNKALSEANWSQIYHSNDVNTAYTIFTDKLSHLIDTHIPIKSVKFSKLKLLRRMNPSQG